MWVLHILMKMDREGYEFTSECAKSSQISSKRNTRRKSTIEKKCDQIKRRKSQKLLKTDVGSSSAQPQISLPTFNMSSSVSHVQHHMGEGSFPSSLFHSSYYSHPSNISTGFMPPTALSYINESDKRYDSYHLCFIQFHPLVPSYFKFHTVLKISGSFASAARMSSSPSSMVAGFRTEAVFMLFKVQIFAVDYVICGGGGGGGRSSTEVVVE
ncbi:LOW QUALITY PROTEIN: hypothetical protein Cgig2_013631 [Carnegiea gigantea]|uniref:Uncharacterized protein n=1 Tax=Carnegiea gigantea TaxID=171969 RepID=A0A9Q1QFQ2_9CARY|nr:LOW QUALITY PROTEIN: hypothetical protein Cgig2_013631 [Carnegiea gigantea]